MKFLSLRWKISIILFLSNFLVGIVLVVLIGNQVRQDLGKELMEKGQIIAQNLAQYAVELIIEEDQVALKQLISSSITYESVEYVIVQKEDLTVLADTYNGEIPKELADKTVPENDILDAENIYIESSAVDVFDVWHPIEEGYLGYIRIGIRQNYIQDKIKQTAFKVIITISLAILVAWIIIIFLISRRVINPIMYLTNQADEISQGKLEQEIKIKTGDEIELLGDALERLRESVKIALDRLKKHQTMRM